MDEYIVLFVSDEAGVTVDEHENFQDAFNFVLDIVKESDFSFDGIRLDILRPKGNGLASALTPKHWAQLKKAHRDAIREREEAI